MRIFLSAVSGQFKECRDALASDLRAVGAEVVVQEDFQQQGRSLLEKLEWYIASCDRVIALIGDAYGYEPDPAVTPGLRRRSYTQWEYSFATGERLLTGRQPAIDTYVYFAVQAFLASHPVAQDAGATQRQKSFVAEVLESGKDRSEFGSVNELRALVLRDGFRMPSGNQAQLNQTTAALRVLPRPPLVGFIPRSDKQGRDILRRLEQELNPARNQLVALWGPGGVGKTALAAQAAHDWAAEFGSRVVWVGVDQLTDFTLENLLDAIISQLGGAEPVQSSPADKKVKVRAVLRQAASLVVVDNFETVPPENQRDCVSWLADTSACTVLLTTRDSLSFKREGVDLALNIVVESMTKDEASQFIERHAALADNPEAIGRIGLDAVIQAADGNPLLMQWIVAQIGLAQSPGTVFEQLAHGKGGAVERVFDRSYNLPQLGDDGRATLLALSLFVSSASRQALMEVAGFDQELERLNEAVRRLRALRLLSTANSGERLGVQGLTRELARARLAGSPRAIDFRRRYVNVFLRCRPGQADLTRQDRNALDLERDNLLGAIEVAYGIEGRESVPVLAANTVGASVQAFFRKDASGHKQPVSETEYQKIGRAALASLLKTNDPRCIPLQSDALWSELLEVGPSPLMEIVLRNNGVSFPAPSRSDYLRIVWWATAMSRLSAILVELLSLEETNGVESKERISMTLRPLKAAVLAVKKNTEAHFGEPWDLVVMARASQI